MLKRHHRFFQSIQILRDVILVGAAFLLAYLCRFSFPGLMPFGTISPPQETLWVGIMLAALWPMVGWLSGLYVSRRSRSVGSEFFDVFRVSVVTFLVLVTLTYFVREERFSRGILVLWAMFAIAAVSTTRILSRVAMRGLRSRGYNLRHVVVVGTGDLGRRVAESIREQASLGMRVKGFVAAEGDGFDTGDHLNGLPVLGKVNELGSILGRAGIDQVLVALPVDQLGALKRMMQVLSRETVDVRVIPDFYQFMTLCGSVEEFAGLPIINLQSTPIMGWSLVTKRMFDFLAAAVGLMLVAPLMLIIAAAVRLSSPGPIFYRQVRVGMDGRRFPMVKFRTMRMDAESDGAHMTLPGDARRTRVGAMLRRLSLDELPQLWNVLTGDMSLVGPRPERPCFIEDFKREIPRYALRHKIKAGITGWAQVNGMRGNTSIAKRIEMDLYYIENWSLMLDLKILLRTVLGGFMSPNAY